jgi:hypothetical protein
MHYANYPRRQRFAIAQLNQMTQDEFVAVLGAIFEKTLVSELKDFPRVLYTVYIKVLHCISKQYC